MVLAADEAAEELWGICDKAHEKHSAFVADTLDGPFLPEATGNLVAALAAALAVESDRATSAVTFARALAAARYQLPRKFIEDIRPL